MSTFYCKKCNNNSWNAPFIDNLCDKCWEKEEKKKNKIKKIIKLLKETAEQMNIQKDGASETTDFILNDMAFINAIEEYFSATNPNKRNSLLYLSMQIMQKILHHLAGRRKK